MLIAILFLLILVVGFGGFRFGTFWGYAGGWLPVFLTLLFVYLLIVHGYFRA